MKGLRCTTKNCEHNVNTRCLAGVINVGQDAKCATKLKREGGVLSQQFNDYEVSELDMPDVETIVSCNARCIYNHNQACDREHLLVEDTSFATKCRSRIK